ncbi:pectinesterase family protein [Flavobacterium sp. UBA6135]|uniref:pectinesterase family protein n=1 Tax=Flavobacterium sp. UBA6135 TaxID=1946553 RepID=UPI0025B9AB49|nr:pectinesterase family protein [Flavobacterium sp. UBA6135]
MIKKLQFIVLFCVFYTTATFSQSTDVWDFGATQLDNTLHNNRLNEAIINSWYDASITPGSVATTNTMPVSFISGPLTWVGAASDRLRSTNTAITRYDNNVASVASHNGRVYCNGNAGLSNGSPTSRYFILNVNEDDEVTIIARGDTAGLLSFVYQSNPTLQTNTFPITATAGSVTEVKFVAKYTGNYLFYDTTSKASFYRIYRKDAVYTSVTGAIDVSQAAGITDGYSIVFTNEAGKSWTAQINAGIYSVNVPVGYSYAISLLNASGYIISSGDSFDTTGVVTPTVNHPIAIAAVSLYTVTGTITGLGTSISNLNLNFVPNPSSGSLYVPSPIVNTANATYSVQLEPNVQYTISGSGVNDYEIVENTLTIPAENTTHAIAFSAKPVHSVTMNISGLNATQVSNLQLIFTNLNESGYVYEFNNVASIALRNGTYGISFNGLDNHPVELGLVSNLVVNNNPVTKSLEFQPVTVWSFNDRVINSTTTAFYKGMQLNGQITTVVASGHLTAKTGATLLVPINPGFKVVVSYYYTANFSIEGGATITTATNSTSIVENIEYAYTGNTPGFVTITVGGLASLTTYFTEIKVVPNVAYSPSITVGTDKDYQTINEALLAVSYMVRSATDRVTILIDSGNYEEMLVIDQPNITLKNAATTPNTNLVNGGVNITDGAVRVTSYYGHGYHYYSMGSNQKWNQDVLNVNMANGNYSHTNAGAGTTNGSYWNATVVVRANGFEAEGIIFENSFNQYISTKESQDVVVAWSSGSPGVRPINYGNTSVQNKTFVERAAAIAIANNIDKVILNKCRVVGRQDSFFGGSGSRVVVYKGDVMGAVDFIFGGMDAVFYKTNLVMNTSDQSSDLSYITAAQQSSGRGFLLYECTITTAQPLIEIASVYRSKPGYFGRPWQANTSEVVFYNTNIETSNYPGFIDQSLIMPLGWLSTLGGTSSGMYEIGTIENSGVNNIPFRASWATTLTTPVLNDGTAITTFNFTKGNDNWDPLPSLINNDTLSTDDFNPQSSVKVFSANKDIYINNVNGTTTVTVYALNGAKVKSFVTNEDVKFNMTPGLWIVNIQAQDGSKSIKVITN